MCVCGHRCLTSDPLPVQLTLSIPFVLPPSYNRPLERLAPTIYLLTPTIKSACMQCTHSCLPFMVISLKTSQVPFFFLYPISCASSMASTQLYWHSSLAWLSAWGFPAWLRSSKLGQPRKPHHGNLVTFNPSASMVHPSAEQCGHQTYDVMCMCVHHSIREAHKTFEAQLAYLSNTSV